MNSIIKQWEGLDFKDPMVARKVIGAIQHFMQQPDKNQEIKAAVRHFTTTGDFPTNINEIVARYLQLAHYDNAYEDIFDIRDFTQGKMSGFDIYDVQSGVAFVEVPVGGKIKLEKLSGTKVSVSFVQYGGGIGYHDIWFQDCQWWQIEDTTLTFRNEAYRARAAAFYALITALGAGVNVAWQAPVPAGLANTDPNYAAVRDMRTMNAACLGILTSLLTSGLGATDQSEFILLAPQALKDRISRAMAMYNIGLAGNYNLLQYNITVRYTLMLSNLTSYYIFLPKRQLKGGIRQNLTIKTDYNLMSNTHDVGGYMRFGGAIAETDQCRRCATS